ncbi:F-box protein-like [Dorcoceras hygrometricum]|uniref:F-box protein-like n=1 Tax=Dorcoceras hygrometricum TaxID=472368 RepID=A0A2Z7CPH2_9LAMI|nr:F-box protein-like [Dorcoceras hygrometricum]
MFFGKNSTNVSTAAAGGDTITAIHPDIIGTHILRRLDGATLASTSCASSQLLSLCSDDQLWRSICNSTWPSTTDTRVLRAISAFPSGHRSFYSDSFPSAHHELPRETRSVQKSELISAVDIYFEDRLIYSKVLETETVSNWFLSFPLSLELLDPKEIVPTTLKIEEDSGDCASLAAQHLKLSWILIDPNNGRAVNVASRTAVESRRNWSDGDIQLRFATVVASATRELVQCAVLVNCGGKDGGELHLKEVKMQVEDMEGRTLSGRDSFGILQAAMEGRRRRIDCKREKDIYESFLKKKVQYKEKQQMRERGLDMICIVIGLSIFFSIWIFCFRRYMD